MSELFLGVDAGLTTIKAALFTPTGGEVAVASTDTPVDRPAPGHHEVSLAALWAATADTIETVLDDMPEGDTVAAVGVAGHGHGLYLLDDNGDELRPAIRSTDSRATDLVDEWEADGTASRIRQEVGYEPFAADPLSLLGWLDRHEPETIDRIGTVCFCKDYLKYRLTGRLSTDEMEASVFYGPDDEYTTGPFEAIDVPLSADVFPEVVPSRDVCGTVTEDASAETGLPAGTPVASGLHDVGATALGAGAHGDGQGVLIVGTWGQSIVVLDEHDRTDGTAPPGLTRRYLDDGYLRYKGLRSAAVCLDWFTGEVGGEWQRRADAEGISEYAVYDRVAADVPAGAGGLLFHPYLAGSTDEPADKGGFYGLTTDHTKADMLRAVYEGVALAQSGRLRELVSEDGLRDVRIGGGGARSAVWCDVFAAALDHSLQVPDGDETGARGAAICGALAAGAFPDHATAVDEMVSIERRHEPDPDAAEVYGRRAEIFEDALTAVRPTWKRLMTAAENGDTHE